RDVPCLVSVLSSDQLSERKVGGQWGAAHLAAILAASLQLAARATGGQGELDSARKASKSKAATAKGDSHQEGSLALMAKLPGLIRKFQTEAAVVLPLLTCARELRFELFALRSEERGLGNLLALVADQVSRHADSRVVAAAADCLVHVVSAGPGSLQAAAQLALNNVVTKTGNAFASAAKAVMQLDDEELASEVEELAGGTDEVAEGAQTLWRLHCAAVRVSSLLARNVMGLAAHAACRDALARLLAEAGSKGRLLGPRIMAALLAAAQAALLIGALQLNTSKPAETQVLLPPGATTPAPGVGGAGEGAAAAAAEGGNEEDGNAGNEVAPVGRKKGKGGKGKKAGKAAEIGNGGGGEREREGEGGEQQQAGAVRGAAGGQLKAQRQAAEQLHAAVRQHGACLVTLFSAAEPCPTTHDLVFRAMGDLLVLFGDKAWGPASGGAAAGPASAPGHHGEPAVGVEHDAALGQLVATFWEGCLMVLHSSRAGLEEPGELEEDGELAWAHECSADLAARRPPSRSLSVGRQPIQCEACRAVPGSARHT
ncbi:SCD domain-containing protein, partial [Haematococcus lacustris]